MFQEKVEKSLRAGHALGDRLPLRVSLSGRMGKRPVAHCLMPLACESEEIGALSDLCEYIGIIPVVTSHPKQCLVVKLAISRNHVLPD